jgi:plastocyanin
VTVSVGGTVEWSNSDAAPHTATAEDNSFDTGSLDKGDTAKVTFDEPGTIKYICTFHPFMNATVEVVE